MTDVRFDVVGLGNAIVDVLSRADDAFLAEWGIHKNAMNLIEEDRAHALTKVARDPLFTSGGSGANTIAGLASFGGSAAYIGKVADDELGRQFRSEMEASGVPFATSLLKGGPATARSIIFVTDDGHRSMNTFLGASVLFSRNDVDADVVRAGGILYLEGYLFDKDDADKAIENLSGGEGARLLFARLHALAPPLAAEAGHLAALATLVLAVGVDGGEALDRHLLERLAVHL